MRWNAWVGAVFIGCAVFVPCANSWLDVYYLVIQRVVFIGRFGLGIADFICNQKSVFGQSSGVDCQFYAGTDVVGLYV